MQCSDVNWPRNWAKWDADTRRVYRTAPFEAWDNAWFNAACAFWPVQGPARPLQIRGAGLPGILMIQGTLDAATPYAGALVARKLLPRPGWWWCCAAATTASRWSSPQHLRRRLPQPLPGDRALPSRPGLVNAVCPATPLPAAVS